MKSNSYVKKIIELSNQVNDRLEFHKQSETILLEMGKDEKFWAAVFRENLSDKGFLNRKWSMYEIPFFYVYENDDFYVKVHLFVPLKNYQTGIAASAIHHHNNYLLTSYAAFGSGYESMLFEKDLKVNPDTKEVNLRIRKRFHQKDERISRVGSWEPHVVINPESLSATLVLWSPDKKRTTDSLRSNPLLKAFKRPLRKLIYLLGMDKKIGIAAEETYQYFVKDNKFYGILEDDFFAPTRAQVGSDVDNYSVQTLFAFMQRMGFKDKEFISSLKKSPDVPVYYHKWIDMFVAGEPIADTFAKETINIPGGVMTVEDILRAEEVSRKI
ncbi:hypothetical protein CNR22_06890 [Sphingobacteriaceae bacterium]|nr:hypothetical protein CNR22_06890 [Sphingobacteriaceae bacterium]